MLHLHDTDIPDDVRKDKINGRILDFTSACFADDHILYIGKSIENTYRPLFNEVNNFEPKTSLLFIINNFKIYPVVL